MAESFSFDVVSDFDRQELVNSLDQVKREISQRYDLKGTDTKVDLDKENIFIITNSELTLNAVNDIIRQKAIKRNLSLKIFDYGEIEIVSGNKVRQTILLKQGIKQEIIKPVKKKGIIIQTFNFLLYQANFLSMLFLLQVVFLCDQAFHILFANE